MNAIFFATAMLALGAPDVQAAPQSTTQLYVKTIPPGAAVTVDGKPLGRSDKLFDMDAGAHKLALQLEGYDSVERSIDVHQGEITRVAVELIKRSGGEVVLSYVGDSSDARQSFADYGHAVAFQRPANTKSIVAVKLFASRFGYPKPPDEDFHIYLLDKDKKVLEQVSVPYGKIERGGLRWYTIDFPSIEVPEEFFVAVWFNCEAAKGIFLGLYESAQPTHSYSGLPDRGFQKVDQGGLQTFDHANEWMIRAVVSSEGGKKPTHPKVTTYENEKAADTENSEALPTRTWNDSTGAFSVEAQFAGMEQGKVMLKKADGKTVAVPLDRLSKEDQEFLAQQTNANEKRAKPGAGEVRELSHDNGKKASQSSIPGGGHAVRFQVDGNSWYVTSLKLHGSRYGEPRPPKEDFNVWICDAQWKPLATFHFPYSSYTRGNPDWKTFRIRPTRVPQEFIVCFGFNPQQTKGVFVSYDDQPSKTSMIGVPGKGQPTTFAKGNWLIRCKVEKHAESATKMKQ
jgi:hypothetical protein